ncbi:MAG TPA: efflux RND transporter permease subunit [Opitutaceae bacterium]|jgi:CzcA family heavy metal efflux pump
MSNPAVSRLGRFATRNSVAILFVAAVLCLTGVFSALTTPSSVFPQTDFPRVTLLVDNGIMSADEMMALVTRPIEDAMKQIPGAVSVRTATGRGSAEINVLFSWRTDMVQAELYVLGRLGEIKGQLPSSATTEVQRLTFSAFPILGISLTSPSRDLMSLWSTAQYDIKPRLLQIPGLASIQVTGGSTPEYHIEVDPIRLQDAQLSLQDVSDALSKNNVVAAAGMVEQDYHLYMVSVDGRAASADDLAHLVITVRNGHPIRVGDIARVVRAPAPNLTVVTANGRNAVLLNLMSQPNGSTLQIASAVEKQLKELRRSLPPDMQLAYFYDQSTFVRDSVGSVWEAIFFGLILSVVILFLFLRNWGSVTTAIFVIPITVLITFISLKAVGMSFNMMTLGGVAAAIGLVIDDAIVVVESIFAQIAAGLEKREAVEHGLGEILHALIGSTLTPVVVFLPLAFLDGITGVFFRALALTMVVSLVTSLVLAVTVTPALAASFLGKRKGHDQTHGAVLRRATAVYERAMRSALARPAWVMAGCAAIAVAGMLIYRQLKTDFLPSFDEGGFVIDYTAPFGTSLTETSRMLNQAEAVIRNDPDVESYSRRLGTQLGLYITEPNNGDYLVKLRAGRHRSTDEVMAGIRHQLAERLPAIDWDLHGILTDLVGDLVLTPNPIEVKIFSPDLNWLKQEAPHVEEALKSVSGVVDTFNGLTQTGPSFVLRVRPSDAARFGLSAGDIASALDTALLGNEATHIASGDQLLTVRVLDRPGSLRTSDDLRHTLLRTPAGDRIQVQQVADLVVEPSQVELDREDLRQEVTISGRLEGRDLGSAMEEIQSKLAHDSTLPAGSVEYGGLFQQQQESFINLLLVLLMALLLVFTVLVIEFRSFLEPVAIVFGAVLALAGAVTALWLTGTSLNVVAFLGAIIGVGLVAKNGILMLDRVDHLHQSGASWEDAILQSGARRLRPVLMTTLAAAIGMLPLAWGIGTGAQMLQPLAIAVIGALCISMLLSLIGTPTLYYLLARRRERRT